MPNNKFKKLQIEVKFNEKFSQEQGFEKLFWAMDFISNLGDEIGEAGDAPERKKCLPVVGREAPLLDQSAAAGPSARVGRGGLNSLSQSGL